MDFKDILLSILKDLDCYKRDKNNLLSTYIEERLSQSLKTYYKELSASVNYLANKNNSKIIGKINE